jgi:hypothetical protein
VRVVRLPVDDETIESGRLENREEERAPFERVDGMRHVRR